ncbi:hypothetical protein FJTKL_07760 [Diaporthe vaccinii]|uniref:Uncharacterized protein n=1 Tax=Diaporthe vaccinii TaxID=105482 RepID=A0ABR4FD85_9PEZI
MYNSSLGRKRPCSHENTICYVLLGIGRLEQSDGVCPQFSGLNICARNSAFPNKPDRPLNASLKPTILEKKQPWWNKKSLVRVRPNDHQCVVGTLVAVEVQSPHQYHRVSLADSKTSNQILRSLMQHLNLAASAEDTDTHRAKQVVGSVGVEVDTTVEYGGGILSNARGDESLATGVVLDEVGHVVDDTGDSNKTPAILGLLDIVVPVDDRQLLERHTPVKLDPLLVELLLLLLETALLDLVLAEGLQVGGEAELLPEPDRPLGRVILPPADCVAVVRGELVVEVVVSLAQSDERGDDVVPGAVTVVEGLIPEPVGQTVDTEGCLLDEEDAEDPGINIAAPPVTPAKTGDQGREHNAHEDDGLDEVQVLPDDDGVLVEVGDVGSADSLGVLLHDHPTDVAVHQAFPH